MMSPTLHDIMAITGLPLDGDKVSYLHDVLEIDLGFKVSKKNNAYSTFINTLNNGSGLVGETEHRAFLLFWICHFFFCTNSTVMVAKFTPYVLAVLSPSYLNIDAFFLSLLYKGMFTILYWMKK